MSEEIHKITEYTRENQEPKSEQLRMTEIIQQLVKLHNEYASGMLELDKKQAAADEKMHTLEMQEALLMREVEKMRSENIDYWKQKKEELVTLKKISETLGSAPSGNPPEQGEKFKKLNQENAILKKQYAELYQKSQKQESELYELKDIRESLTIQLEKLQEEREKLKERLQEFQNEQEYLRKRLEDQECNADELNVKIQKLECEIAEQQEERNYLMKENEDLKTEVNWLQMRKMQDGFKYRNEIEALKKKCEELERKTSSSAFSMRDDVSIYDSLDRGILDVEEDDD